MIHLNLYFYFFVVAISWHSSRIHNPPVYSYSYLYLYHLLRTYPKQKSDSERGHFRPYLSIRLFIVLYQIFPSLFTCCSSFDRIILSVSLSCCTGSFSLSLHVVRRSMTLSCCNGSFPLSLRVVSILFLFVVFSNPGYLSVRLFIVSYLIISPLFTCRFDSFVPPGVGRRRHPPHRDS